MPDQCTFTVIIPAHNEAAVIGETLTHLQRDAPQGNGMEVIVVANDCSDDTARVAREAAPTTRVLELNSGSKTGAINAGNAQASYQVRIILDADVLCSYATAHALAKVLREPGVMTAAPAIRLDLEGADRLTQAYYRVWMRQPYAKAGKGGAGCYGLSAAALEQVGEFPDIIGDDIWIHTRFPEAQTRYVQHDARGEPVYTVVRPPRRAGEQVRVEARRQVGTRQVLSRHPSPHAFATGGTSGVKHAISNARSLFDLCAFTGIKLSARLLGRFNQLLGRGENWARDDSTRSR